MNMKLHPKLTPLADAEDNILDQLIKPAVLGAPQIRNVCTLWIFNFYAKAKKRP